MKKRTEGRKSISRGVVRKGVFRTLDEKKVYIWRRKRNGVGKKNSCTLRREGGIRSERRKGSVGAKNGGNRFA